MKASVYEGHVVKGHIAHGFPGLRLLGGGKGALAGELEQLLLGFNGMLAEPLQRTFLHALHLRPEPGGFILPFLSAERLCFGLHPGVQLFDFLLFGAVGG